MFYYHDLIFLLLARNISSHVCMHCYIFISIDWARRDVIQKRQSYVSSNGLLGILPTRTPPRKLRSRCQRRQVGYTLLIHIESSFFLLLWRITSPSLYIPPIAFLGLTKQQVESWLEKNRSKRGLNKTRSIESYPEEARTILEQWLDGHMDNPFPSVLELNLLARETGLTDAQVDNWFDRTRAKKGLVSSHQSMGSVLLLLHLHPKQRKQRWLML